AIRAGDEVGCSTVEELTLQAPLMLPAKDSGIGSVAVQVLVGEADESGRRDVSIFSRPDSDSPWVCHAQGTLSTGSIEPGADLAAWPPAGAT
ncbi:polyketide synthase dehydratase domain-containing protein, partial [Mycobacterium avium]